MLVIEGIGDPSKGRGGYSYLKLPLKMSQDTHVKPKTTPTNVQTGNPVSGTDADLRKLSKERIHELLRLYGYNNVEKIDRWQGVNII